MKQKLYQQTIFFSFQSYTIHATNPPPTAATKWYHFQDSEIMQY